MTEILDAKAWVATALGDPTKVLERQQIPQRLLGEFQGNGLTRELRVGDDSPQCALQLSNVGSNSLRDEERHLFREMMPLGRQTCQHLGTHIPRTSRGEAHLDEPATAEQRQVADTAVQRLPIEASLHNIELTLIETRGPCAGADSVAGLRHE